MLPLHMLKKLSAYITDCISLLLLFTEWTRYTYWIIFLFIRSFLLPCNILVTFNIKNFFNLCCQDPHQNSMAIKTRMEDLLIVEILKNIILSLYN